MMATHLWDKLPSESDSAFAHFEIFRDLGEGRSIDATYAKSRGASGGASRAPGSFRKLKAKYDWLNRAAAWDAHQRQNTGQTAGNQPPPPVPPSTANPSPDAGAQGAHPSTHGESGKDASGRFVEGNKLGKGNPLAGQAAKIRAMLLESLTPSRAQAVINRLILMAGKGDLDAIKELFNRTIGKPSETQLLERVERLEALQREKDIEPEASG